MTRMTKQFPFFLITIIFFSCTNKPASHSAEMDGMEQAMRHEFRMTRDPYLNRIPSERLIAAKAYMESLVNNNGIASRGEGIAALTWQERGPNNVGGRTRAILVDKRDATG